jgi:hypothetical protein
MTFTIQASVPSARGESLMEFLKFNETFIPTAIRAFRFYWSLDRADCIRRLINLGATPRER